MLTIGKVAKETGLTIVAIRHYEKLRLIESTREDNGYRYYSDEDMTRLQLIKKAKELGFSLKEIEALIKLESIEAKGSDVKQVLHQKLARVEAQIKFLMGLKETYQGLLKSCHGNMPVSECPIMRTLKSAK